MSSFFDNRKNQPVLAAVASRLYNALTSIPREVAGGVNDVAGAVTAAVTSVGGVDILPEDALLGGSAMFAPVFAAGLGGATGAANAARRLHAMQPQADTTPVQPPQKFTPQPFTPTDAHSVDPITQATPTQTPTDTHLKQPTPRATPQPQRQLPSTPVDGPPTFTPAPRGVGTSSGGGTLSGGGGGGPPPRGVSTIGKYAPCALAGATAGVLLQSAVRGGL